MDSQRYVFDSVKAEKANAMRRYRWRQSLRWLWKACLPLATLSYALSRDAPRQLLLSVFNSNLCVFLLLNSLVVVTCVLSGVNFAGSDKSGGVWRNDIYGEYVANVESTRRSDVAAGFKVSDQSVTSEAEEEDLVKNKLTGHESPPETETTPPPEEVSILEVTESYENVSVETLLPVCENKAVTECKIVVAPVSSVTTTNSSDRGEESEKVKSYRRTQSESFEKRKEAKRGLHRSETVTHRKTEEPERRSSVEELSDEEFKRQVELFINRKKYIQMLEDRII